MNKQQGFSLIELMITVGIAGILTAIAVPIYMNQVRQSRRTDARTALLDLAGREERFFSTNNGTYSSSPYSLGYSSSPTATFPVTIGSGYYSIGTPVVAAATATAVATFTITATPVGSQAADAACASLSINNLGQQTATGTDTNPNVDCWSR